MPVQYSEKVMEHFTNPRNAGVLEDANAVGEVGNPRCGDIMKISMKVNEDTDIIEDVRFQGLAFDATGEKVVIINGKMIKEGGGGGRLTVKKVLKDEVILSIDDEEHRLSIYESNN